MGGGNFRGSASAKIDDRGRLKMPTGFRRILTEKYSSELFITSVLGTSALVYPMPVWEAIEDRLAAMPDTDRVKQRYLERVNYFGQEASMDSQGRVLIPQILRDSAAVAGEVVISGRVAHLEIWNHERFANRLEAEPFTEEDFRALSERGI